MRPITRALIFVLVLVVLPLGTAIGAAVLRSTSQTALLMAAWKTDPRFFATTALHAVGAGMGLALALWAGSLLSWSREAPRGAVRVARIALLLWIAAFVLYPGLGSWVPGFRSLPWIVGVAGLVAGWAATLLVARPSWRELVFGVVAVALVFGNPSGSYPSIPGVAGRALDRRDVILLGFDSMSRDDLREVLDGFKPRSARKIVFDEARTTVPVTSAAWRSALSGMYPRPESTIPGVRWPDDRRAWIPAALRDRGYRPVFLQDSPGTNTFAPDESFAIPDDQGWKAILQEFVWKAAFPLSSGAASWWLDLAGGPAHAAGRYGYCPECFWGRTFRRIGEEARGHPLFAAIHSCHVHAPVHLTLAEATRIARWWSRTPLQLEGSGNPFFDHESEGREAILEVREQSAREVVRGLLEHLETTAVMGHALVVVLSDHGPRGTWVPPERTERIALAFFLPGGEGELRVADPVSLADLAPSLRTWLGLESVPGDGRAVAPLGGTVEPGRRVVVAAVPTLERAGVQLGTVTSETLLRDLVLNRDGTFGYSAAFRSQLRLGEIREVPRLDRHL